MVLENTAHSHKDLPIPANTKAVMTPTTSGARVPAPDTRHIVWTDVAPRDGLQNHPGELSTEGKVELVRRLLEAGASRVEATALVSPRWVPKMADAASVLEQLSPLSSKIRVLIPNRKGLDRAMECGVGNVAVTVAATDAFSQANINMDVDTALTQVEEIVAAAGSIVVDAVVSVAWGCPYSGAVSPNVVLSVVDRLVKAGVAEICIADTIGVATPTAVTELMMQVQKRSSIPTSVHFHDTRGLGVANVMAAWECGVDRFEGSVGGVGGCPFAPKATGNVASEDALFALLATGAHSDVDVARYVETAQWLGEQLGSVPGKLAKAGLEWHTPREEMTGGR